MKLTTDQKEATIVATMVWEKLKPDVVKVTPTAETEKAVQVACTSMIAVGYNLGKDYARSIEKSKKNKK